MTAWRGEVEDGTGWGGLVPTASERRAEKAEESRRQKERDSAARIAHLEGQRGVLVGLLGEALPVLATLDPESADEGELLRGLCDQITAALAAISAEKAGEV